MYKDKQHFSTLPPPPPRPILKRQNYGQAFLLVLHLQRLDKTTLKSKWENKQPAEGQQLGLAMFQFLAKIPSKYSETRIAASV